MIGPIYPTPFKLQDVRDAFGDPSHVLAGSSLDANGSPFYSLALVYLSHGFRLDVRLEDQASKPVLSPDMLVESPAFFVPTEQGFLDAFNPTGTTNKTSIKALVPWQGFRDFDFYCRERDGAGCT